MAARQLRWLLFSELLIYSLLASWLLTRGWTPLEAASLALGSFLGLRLFVTALTFTLMLGNSDAIPAEFRMGPVRALHIALEEYAGLLALFTVIQPFDAFWLGPDRLSESRRVPGGNANHENPQLN